MNSIMDEQQEIVIKDDPCVIKDEPVWSINIDEILIKDEPMNSTEENHVSREDMIRNILLDHKYCREPDNHVYPIALTVVEEEIAKEVDNFAFIDVNDVDEPELDLNDKYTVISKCIIYCPKCNDGNVRVIMKECRKCKTQCIIKCNICEVKFTSYYLFKAHLKQHFKIKEFTYHCNFCAYKCTENEELVAHKKYTHGSRLSSYKCKVCGISFRQQTALMNHNKFCTEALNQIKTNLKESRSEVEIISADEPNNPIGYDIVPLDPKLKDDEDSVARYCSNCDLSCPSLFEKKKRLVLQPCQQCNVPTIYQCAHCKKAFDRYNSLLYHLKHNCNAKKLFLCKECGYSTPNITNMRQHIDCKHSDKNLIKKCSKCEKILKNTTYLKRHEARCGSEPNIKCKYCSKSTHYLRIFRNHLLKVHRLHRSDIENIYDHVRNEDELRAQRRPERPVRKPVAKEPAPRKSKKKEVPPCNLCGQSFKRRSVYMSHIKKCGKEPPLQCGHCSFKSFIKAHMTRHMERFHKPITDGDGDAESQPKINLNSYKFFWKGIIIAHCIICNEPRSIANRYKRCFKCKTTMVFKCEKCNDNQFCAHLQDYMKQLMYECEKCSKAFLTNQLLNHHATHCGLPARFNCSYCEYKSKFKSCTERHMRLVHADNQGEKE